MFVFTRWQIYQCVRVSRAYRNRHPGGCLYKANQLNDANKNEWYTPMRKNTQLNTKT